MQRRIRYTLAVLVALGLWASATSCWAGIDEGRWAYERGDYATAWRKWRPLADQGDAPAQFYLGLMYDEGKGVPQDYTQAVWWYRLAAAQGNAAAQNNLGIMYVKGWGVSQDYAQAYGWFTRAAARVRPGVEREKAVRRSRHYCHMAHASPTG